MLNVKTDQQEVHLVQDLHIFPLNPFLLPLGPVIV